MIKQRIIALDYGKARIGAAKTDPFRLFAEPMGAFSEPDLFKELHHIQLEHGIETFVVGYPLSYDGSTNPSSDSVDKFITRLSKLFPMTTIVKKNEYGSTIEADTFLKSLGVSRPKRQQKGRLDTTVAFRLLESYLVKP